jgi:hypothetical protein
VPAAYAQAPDNSATNKHPGITAEGQSNSASDLAITRKIRKAIVTETSLSIYAHNIKVITSNETVTPNADAAEKAVDNLLKTGVSFPTMMYQC